MYDDVLALTVYNGELAAGGAFTTAGGNVAAYWARWSTSILADLDSDCDVDVADFLTFQACFNGPNNPPACE